MATGMCYVNTGYKEDDLGSTKLHDPDVFILGCNVAQNMRVLGGSFGLVDAMRIGPDNGRSWSAIWCGPFSGSNTYFLHGCVWYSDPDSISVRQFIAKGPTAQGVFCENDVRRSSCWDEPGWRSLAGSVFDDVPPVEFDAHSEGLGDGHVSVVVEDRFGHGSAW